MDLRKQLSDIVYESGMTTSDFAYAMGISYVGFKRMLMGKQPVSQGHIDDAAQIQSDIIDFEQIVEDNPWLKEMSYKVCKTVLKKYEKEFDSEQSF